MIAAALAFLTSPIGKLVGIAAAVAAVIAAFFIWLGAHDAALRTAWETQQRLAVADAVEQQRVKGEAAIAAEIAASEARLAHITNTKIEIAHVATTTSCASSPAIRAVLSGMRESRSNSGSSSNSATPPRVLTTTTRP